MCKLNYHPISVIDSPCTSCPLYLETCIPTIYEGYTVGSECDLCICDYCPYTDCGWGRTFTALETAAVDGMAWAGS